MSARWRFRESGCNWDLELSNLVKDLPLAKPGEDHIRTAPPQLFSQTHSPSLRSSSDRVLTSSASNRRLPLHTPGNPDRQDGDAFRWDYNCGRMALISDTKLGPYEIQSQLGAGGMGEVYRATDTKLGRDVVLKVLPAEVAYDSERLARFRREAKALAQLDHASIVTIHSVEESDGVHFLTMQLVEGQPLDRLIPARAGSRSSRSLRLPVRWARRSRRRMRKASCIAS